jgi:hypothetical protein
MMWLTWRQFRVQAIAGFGALAVLGVVLGVTGPGLADAYEAGLASCTGEEACMAFTENFRSDHQLAFLGLMAVPLLVPALIGLFWGAPLIAREVETGTHRLVWNQSVPRTRWLAVKLGFTGLAAVAVSGLMSLVVTWWTDPLDKAAAADFPRMAPLLFDVRGIVPIGHAVLAFALGVTVGLLVRRALAAMAITLAVFVAAQIAMPLLVRPYLLPPTRTVTEITAQNLGEFMALGPGSPAEVGVRIPDRGAWILTNETIDKDGRVVETVPVYIDKGPCADRGDPGARGPAPSCFAEIKRLGYRQRLVYHGSDRYWTLQWVETGLCLLAGLGLAGFCFYRIRRNLN